MTLDALCRLLAAECYSAGSQAAWAKKHGMSPAYVSAVLRKVRPPGEKLLLALGLERVTRTVTTYRRVR
jgi:DNA-binding transcriptional regulator YdaS (Cro superfamily)